MNEIVLVPKNWSTFQHYKHRSPPWIKFHKSLLDDYDFQCLPIASKALAPMLWLLASESVDGIIDTSIRKLSFRLRISEKDLVSGIKPLIDIGFFIDASNVLAECKQLATTEKSRVEKSRVVECELFNKFWSLYPRKIGKEQANKIFTKLTEKEKELALARLPSYEFSSDPKYIPHASTWLNQKRWEDEQPTKPEDCYI